MNNNKNKIFKKIKSIKKNLSTFNTSVNKSIYNYNTKTKNFCFESENKYINLSCNKIIKTNEKLKKNQIYLTLKKKRKWI